MTPEDAREIRRHGLGLALDNAISGHPKIVKYYWALIAEYFTHE